MHLRIPSAKKMAVARLAEYVLKFHKRNRDNSAKCDIEYTGCPKDVVHGVVYRLSAAEKMILDDIEGLGRGYEAKQLTIETLRGELIKAFSYYATDIDPLLRPYHWYKKHVLVGARENSLPVDHIDYIEQVISVEDDDIARQKRELAIYDLPLQLWHKS